MIAPASDALFNRAVAAGAQVAVGPMGTCRISSGATLRNVHRSHGYRWTIATGKEDLSPQEMGRRQADWMKQFAPQPTHR